MKNFTFNKERHYYELDGKRMYGVTSVLGVIAKPALIPWAVKMATDYIESHVVIGHYNLSTKTGSIEFDMAFQDLIKEAKSAHRKKKEDAGAKGTDAHEIIEELVTEAISKNNGYLFLDALLLEDNQVHHFVKWASDNNIQFLASEKQMYCDTNGLFVAGTCDLIFKKDGKTYIGDVKTQKKLWDRTPMLQCAAYGLMYENMTSEKIDGYCIIRVSEDGTFEEQWSYDVKGDTEGFLAAYTLFKTLENWSR